MAAERYIALVDAALAEASAGTSTLMHRSETCNLLLDLRNEIQGLAEFDALALAYIRDKHRRQRFKK